MAILTGLFDTAGLTPHGFCLSWDPDLMFLHVISDALIGIAYFSIPICLTVFVVRRNDLVFRWAFALFALFIVACGTTHFLSIWTLWHPDYGTEGLVKAATAIVSILTAIQLWPLIPKALALPAPSELRAANAQLLQQIQEREAIEARLRREIAERQRTEAMLFEAQKLEAIGKLTGGIAHDFNNLLTAVIGNLELLERRVSDNEELRRYTTRAIKAASRGGALTQQLLAFARRQALHSETFDVAHLIGEMTDLLRGTLSARVELSIHADDALWPAEADPNQLASAVMNLVINARDAMPHGGRVSIELHNAELDASQVEVGTLPGEFVAISVADTGTGMTESVRAMAFEPFFTTKPVGQGSGLGLSQVYGFVRQIGGHVTLSSKDGQGTTVTLYLRRGRGRATGGSGADRRVAIDDPASGTPDCHRSEATLDGVHASRHPGENTGGFP